MSTYERVLQVVYAAVDDHNADASQDRHLPRSEETALYGRAGALDSLGLVNLIVAVEERVAEEFGAEISVTDERALSERETPFATLGSLAGYIARVIESGGAG